MADMSNVVLLRRSAAVVLWVLSGVSIAYVFGLSPVPLPEALMYPVTVAQPVPVVAGVWLWVDIPLSWLLSWAVPLSVLAWLTTLLVPAVAVVLTVVVGIVSLLFLASPRFVRAWVRALHLPGAQDIQPDNK